MSEKTETHTYCMKCGINLSYLLESEIYRDKDKRTYCKACYESLKKDKDK